MVQLIPPHKKEIDQRVEQFSLLSVGIKSTYISGAITTGKDFLNWYIIQGRHIENKEDFKHLHYNDVVAKNLDTIKFFAANLRTTEGPQIIEPASLDVAEWSQPDYLYYWGQIITKYVDKIIFIDGWHYSKGCVYEYFVGLENGVELVDQNFQTLNNKEALQLIRKSIQEYQNNDINVEFQQMVLSEIEKMKNTQDVSQFTVEIKKTFQLKDEVLDYISSTFNVAQFASYSPHDLTPRYSRIYGFEPNYHFPTVEETLQVLINYSQDKSINVRTFKPGLLKGNPFYYGIKNAGEAYDLLKKSASEGFYTIVNETIDINDSGVSGVVMNDIIEFSPNDTPKCVEKPGICSLPRSTGLNILHKIYGFYPNLDFQEDFRVEFSIHPKRRGFRKEHTIIWEVEQAVDYKTDFQITWPNNFSRFIGDKAFGLLVADELGALVPKATLLSRNVAPFSFGKETGLSEVWFRTCPSEKTPGKYPTYFGWADPFKVLNSEELLLNVVSILSQNSVDALFSGAVVPSKKGLLIEGVNGFGDDFMVGKQSPTNLSIELKEKISTLYNSLFPKLGEISIEWVFDGSDVWIVQLTKSAAISSSKIIYPGKVSHYIKFYVEDGLEALREIVKTIEPSNGIELIGIIGITSHFGDVLRNAHIPSKLNSI